MRFILAHDIARRRAMQAVADAPAGHVVTINEPTKSREQEEKYHAQIGEIADAFRLNGKKLGAETMKRLLIDQFKHETLGDPDLSRYWKTMAQIEMMPSLDGARVIVLGTQSRHFPKPLASAFIEWLNAWAAVHVDQEESTT